MKVNFPVRCLNNKLNNGMTVSECKHKSLVFLVCSITFWLVSLLQSFLFKFSFKFLFVLNNNEKLTPDDLELLDLIKDKNYIIFVNKNDLPANIDLPIGKYTNVVYGNTLTTAGIKELKEMITTIFNLEKINTNDPTYITNARHKALIEVALNYLNSALENIDNGYSVDMLEIDIRACWDTLGEIIGATYKDELLDELFSNFCLGK